MAHVKWGPGRTTEQGSSTILLASCRNPECDERVLLHVSNMLTYPSLRSELDPSAETTLETLFGLGARTGPDHTLSIGLSVLHPDSAEDIVDDRAADMAVAMSAALETTSGVVSLGPFGAVLAVGELVGDEYGRGFSLEEHTIATLHQTVASLRALEALSPALVVAPKQALDVFRHLSAQDGDARTLTSIDDLFDLIKHPGVMPRLTMLTIHPGIMHFRALCRRLRDLLSDEHEEFLLHIPPGPPMPRAPRLVGGDPVASPSMLFAKTQEAPVGATEVVQGLQERLRGDRGEQGHRVIADRYRLIGELGEGGFAKVYRARDEKMRRDVALKLLSPELIDSSVTRAHFLDRFSSEVALNASLDHPHLVPVYDTGVLDEHDTQRPYLIMKLLNGRDLEYHVSRGSLPPQLVHEIGAQALDALSYVHEQGVVHKDLKPANLFLTKNRRGENHVYVMDFGISYDPRSGAGRMTRTGTFAGTIQYMSPEYILEQTSVPEPVLDVFQMGLILSELLTGSPLIPHKTSLPVLIGRYLQKQGPFLPRGFEGTDIGRVLGRAIAFDPNERYANAQEFLNEWRGLDYNLFPTPAASTPREQGSFSDTFLPQSPNDSSVSVLAPTLVQGLRKAKDEPPRVDLRAPLRARTSFFSRLTAVQDRPSIEGPERERGVLFVILGGLAFTILGGIALAFSLELSSPTPPRDDSSPGHTVTEPIVFVIESDPKEATVFLSDEPVGSTPLTVPVSELTTTRTYTLSHPKCEQGMLQLSPDSSPGTYEVQLTRASAESHPEPTRDLGKEKPPERPRARDEGEAKTGRKPVKPTLHRNAAHRARGDTGAKTFVREKMQENAVKTKPTSPEAKKPPKRRATLPPL